MGRKKNYPKLDLSGGKHYVYVHRAKGKTYVGESGRQPAERWQKSHYGGKFKEFIDEVGFDNMVHEVIRICENRKEARLFEDVLISVLMEYGVSLNEQRSGGVCSCEEYVRELKRACDKAYYEAHKEEHKARCKAYNDAHKEELAAKKKAYREAHKEELAAYHKAYYEEHRDDILEKQRLRSQSKKPQNNKK